MPDTLKGLKGLKGIAKSREVVGWMEIEDDVGAEVESMEAADEIDNELEVDPTYLRSPSPTSRKKAKTVADVRNLEKVIEKASEHVIVPGTANEYRK